MFKVETRDFFSRLKKSLLRRNEITIYFNKRKQESLLDRSLKITEK